MSVTTTHTQRTHSKKTIRIAHAFLNEVPACGDVSVIGCPSCARLPACLPVCVCVSVCLCDCENANYYLHLPIHPPIQPAIHPSIHPSIHPFTHPHTHTHTHAHHTEQQALPLPSTHQQSCWRCEKGTVRAPMPCLATSYNHSHA